MDLVVQLPEVGLCHCMGGEPVSAIAGRANTGWDASDQRNLFAGEDIHTLVLTACLCNAYGLALALSVSGKHLVVGCAFVKVGLWPGPAAPCHLVAWASLHDCVQSGADTSSLRHSHSACPYSTAGASLLLMCDGMRFPQCSPPAGQQCQQELRVAPVPLRANTAGCCAPDARNALLGLPAKVGFEDEAGRDATCRSVVGRLRLSVATCEL